LCTLHRSSGIDGDMVRPCTILPFSQITLCSFSSHPPRALRLLTRVTTDHLIHWHQPIPADSEATKSSQAGSQITLACTAQIRMWPHLIYIVSHHTVSSSIVTETQPRMHLSTTVTFCRRFVEHSCLSEKLVSDHLHY